MPAILSVKGPLVPLRLLEAFVDIIPVANAFGQVSQGHRRMRRMAAPRSS